MRILSEIILSVCIPTFNRSEYLSKQLKNISNQIIANNLASSVEIVVSNNCSTDTTAEVIREFKNKFPGNFLNINQQENIGIRNIYQVTRYATGQYILIISDDDVIKINTIKYIIEIIKSYTDLKAITLNINSDKKDTPWFNLPNDKIFYGQNDSLAFLGSHVTFLSSLIFKNSQHQLPDSMKDSLIPHSALFLQCLALPGLHYVCKTPYITYTTGNSSSYSIFKAFFADISVLFQHATNLGYSQIILDGIFKRNIFRFLVVHILILEASTEKAQYFLHNEKQVISIIESNFLGKYKFYKYILKILLQNKKFIGLINKIYFIVKRRSPSGL
jgi:abequosyltransferase